MRSFFYRFEWDEQMLAFRRVAWSPWQALRMIPQALLWGIVVGAASLPLTYSFWETYFVRRVQEKTAAIYRVKQELHSDIRRMERHRQLLYEKMQKFYRPLLGMAPFSAADWAGGMGGASTTHEEVSLYQSQRLLTEYLSLEKQLAEVNARLHRIPCIMPVRGRIVSGYGYRNDPFTRLWQMHTGLDIDAPFGTPVRAAAAGKVIVAGWDNGGYGIQVEIDHLNGIVTKYAHLSRTAVREGDVVLRGQVIGYVGSTGYSTGSHLHYEVIENGVKVNPEKYILLP